MNSFSKNTGVRKGPFVIVCILVLLVPTVLFRDRRESPADPQQDAINLNGDKVANNAEGVYTGKLWSTGQTLGKKLLGETPFARCDVHSVRVGEDKVVHDWIFFEERDAVNVGVFNEAGEFLAFEQTKYAIPGKTLSPVGGFIDDGESPFDAARREVMEELGVGSKRTKEILNSGDESIKVTTATGKSPFGTPTSQVERDEYGQLIGNVTEDEPSWVFLGRYRTAANRGGGFIFTYILINAVPLVDGGGTNAFFSTGDEEAQVLKKLSRGDFSKAVLEGRFQEVKWAATLALGLLYMEKNGL